MPRRHVRKPGSRRYKDNPISNLMDAIDAVEEGMAVFRASKIFGIPYGTLYNRSKGIHTSNHGRPLQIPLSVEEDIVSIIEFCATMKTPVTRFDVRCMVQTMLNAAGIVHSVFTDNLPGRDWMSSFIKRHHLTTRIADNVKSVRVEVNGEVIEEYFDSLEESLQDVEPQNIYNYDETNLTDDPGAKKVITRRGRKRIERKIDHSKSSTSLMFCGNALGEFLPCMVVYKAENLYQGWTEGAPPGTCFDTTKSGWFDGRTFGIWFKNVFVPHLKGPGPFALIGDNLGSHFSKEVLELCGKKNIRFITLPPNSTHLTQPLDLAVFRPAKTSWRDIIERWRRETKRTQARIPKEHFPTLLCKLVNSLKKENLVAGFKGCGIYPLNRQEVLKRIVVTDENMKEVAERHLGPSFIAILEKNVGLGVPAEEKKKKKRGIKVKPGTVVKPNDLDQQVPTASAELPDNPFASICLYNSDDEDAQEKEDVVLEERRSEVGDKVLMPSTLLKPIENLPLKMVIRIDAGDSAQVISTSFNDQGDDDLLFDDRLFQRKPTARSLRTLGVKHPNGSASRGYPKSKKQKVAASVTICSGCTHSCDEEYIKCDVCNDPYHMKCSGVPYKAGQDIDELNFYCDNCTELFNGV